jgi:FdrA protein
MLIAAAELGDIRSNIPLRPEWAVGADLRADGHLMLDFGDDALTQGRAHPMIDQRSRIDRIAAEAATRGAACSCSTWCSARRPPGPGRRAGPALAAAVATAPRRRPGARGRRVAVRHPGRAAGPAPAGRGAARAGASVFLSNAAAARHAVALVTGGPMSLDRRTVRCCGASRAP